MKKIFRKTIRQMTTLLSLFVYVYALILLPALHIHHNNTGRQSCGSENCNNITCDSCTPYSPLQNNTKNTTDADTNQDCVICKILCTTVPLFAFGQPAINVTEILSEPLLISVPQHTQLVYGVLSCRAPPVAC
ncbi:MAG: hypothetical protein LBT09_13265 [Planctomycetaceae bacterium]|jgi:hypothetical protein|nr:hypothetical protein [Planctomycetaceae bacterium]